MLMPGRKYLAPNASSYRYSINGQEKESELNENITTAEFWEYDSRIVRRWNVDPVLRVSESPYLCFAGNPILMSDPLGNTPDKPKEKGKKEGEVATTYATEKYLAWTGGKHGHYVERTRTVSQDWHWYSGNLKRDAQAGWYSEGEYKSITQDWEHGQVMQPKSFLGKLEMNIRGRNWNGYKVDDNGYLTGSIYIDYKGGAGGLEFISGGGLKAVSKAAKLLSKGNALLKEGEYTIYNGLKQVGDEMKLYIGKAKNGLDARYADGGASIFAKAFEGLNKIPNNGIAMGVEQRVMELNGWTGKGSTALSNINNATVKEIYLKAADSWLKNNIPDWQTLYKIPK
jgi:hypothetical protein